MFRVPIGVVLLLIVVTSGGDTQAGINAWTSHGPEESFVRYLIIDPQDPKTIYAETVYRGIFKTSDRGGRWTELGIVSAHLAIDPQDPRILYAGSYGYGPSPVRKSMDGGLNWANAGAGLPEGHRVWSLVIDPEQPDMIYAALGVAGVFRSRDGALSWNPVTSGLIAAGGSIDGEVQALAVDPRNPATLYAGVYGRGLFKSDNRGESWSQVLTHTLTYGALFLAIDKAGHIYVGFSSGLLGSTDGGQSWRSLSLPGSLLTALASDPHRAGTLYAGMANHGVFRSTDAGATWSRAGPSLPYNHDEIRALAVDPVNPDTIYAGNWYSGVFRTVDGGTNWTEINSGLTASWVTALAVDPHNTRTIFAATRFGRVHKSTDGGTSWSPSGDLGMRILALQVNPQVPNTVYAAGVGADCGTYQSRDGGQSWNVLNGPPSGCVHYLTIDQHDPSTLYAGNLRSADGGQSWAQLALPPNIRHLTALSVHPKNRSTLYAGDMDNRVLKSVDGGVQWSVLNNGFAPQPGEAWEGLYPGGIASLVMDRHNPETVYATASQNIGEVDVCAGIFKSMDGGRSWLELDVLGNRPKACLLAMDPGDSMTLYAGDGESRELLKSTDGGATWHALTAPGLTSSLYVRSPLAVDPQDPARLYLGSFGGGVFTLERQIFTLQFAHFGNGSVGTEQIYSQLILFNRSRSRAASAQIRFRDDEGAPVVLDQAQAVPGPIDITLPPHGLRVLLTDGQGELVGGSVRVESDQPLGGVIVFGGTTGVAGVGDSVAIGRGFLAPIQVDLAMQINSGIAVMNLDDQKPAELALDLIRADESLPGSAVSTATIWASGSIRIPPGGHVARFVTEIDWNPKVDLSKLSGIVRVSGGPRLAATVLRTRPGELATMPVAERLDSPAPSQEHQLRFAHFANGADLVSSRIILINLDENRPAAALAALRAPDGRPLAAILNGKSADGEFEAGIAPQSARDLATDGKGPLLSGSVLVSSSTPLAGVILFDGPIGFAGVGAGEVLSGPFLAPVERSLAQHVNTGIAIMNLEEVEAELLFELLDPEGQVLSSAAARIAGRGQMARFLTEFAWTNSPDLSAFWGLLRISSNRPVSATAVQVRPGQFATFPVSAALE